MARPRLIMLISFAAPFLLFGCGEEEATAPPPAVPQKVAAPAPKEAQQPAPDAASVAPQRYVYDPSGRKDPFEPLTTVKKPASKKSTPLTPLENFDLGQLRLIGIILGKGEPRAMVIAPDGKSYILKKGIKVGRNDGTVVKITPEAILVEERYYDFSGEIRKNTELIQLPKREGV